MAGHFWRERDRGEERTPVTVPEFGHRTLRVTRECRDDADLPKVTSEETGPGQQMPVAFPPSTLGPHNRDGEKSWMGLEEGMAMTAQRWQEGL